MGPERRRNKIFTWHLAALEIHAYRDLDKIIWNQSGEFLMFSSLWVAVILLFLRASSLTFFFCLGPITCNEYIAHYVKRPCQAWNLLGNCVRRFIEYELV